MSHSLSRRLNTSQWWHLCYLDAKSDIVLNMLYVILLFRRWSLSMIEGTLDTYSAECERSYLPPSKLLQLPKCVCCDCPIRSAWPCSALWCYRPHVSGYFTLYWLILKSLFPCPVVFRPFLVPCKDVGLGQLEVYKFPLLNNEQQRWYNAELVCFSTWWGDGRPINTGIIC